MLSKSLGHLPFRLFQHLHHLALQNRVYQW